jgi:hypothetical protein
VPTFAPSKRPPDTWSSGCPRDDESQAPLRYAAFRGVLVLPRQEGDAPVPIKPRYDVLTVLVRSDLLRPLQMNQSVANLVIVGLAVIGSLALRLAGRRKENLPRATP